MQEKIKWEMFEEVYNHLPPEAQQQILLDAKLKVLKRKCVHIYIITFAIYTALLIIMLLQ